MKSKISIIVLTIAAVIYINFIHGMNPVLEYAKANDNWPGYTLGDRFFIRIDNLSSGVCMMSDPATL